MSRIFLNPLWEDPSTKQRVRAREKFDNGSNDIIISRDDTETWSILMQQHTEEEIDKATDADIAAFRRARQEREAAQKDEEERRFQEALFSEKLQAFEIEEIKTSKNIKLKRKLRKAKNFTEIHAYSAAMIVDYYEKDPVANQV